MLRESNIAAQVIEPVLAQLETGRDDHPAFAMVTLVDAARVAV